MVVIIILLIVVITAFSYFIFLFNKLIKLNLMLIANQLEDKDARDIAMKIIDNKYKTEQNLVKEEQDKYIGVTHY